MNFLKKKLKPLTSGLTHSNPVNKKHGRDLEDDLYDEYVVEAPPHPSELIALGVNPDDIDVNDPEKLRELYMKAKEAGKEKKINSVLLAKQREKEEIEEKKKTREEWKFFDSLTARVEEAVKESQKTLEQLKETSAIIKLTEPEYELRLTPDQVFKTPATIKREKGANCWVNFSEEEPEKNPDELVDLNNNQLNDKEVESSCPISISSNHKAQDIDLNVRFEEEKKASQSVSPAIQLKESPKPEIDLKLASRPRPRPTAKADETQDTNGIDPFDTSFVTEPVEEPSELIADSEPESSQVPEKVVDPFDTSFVSF